jgi:hypothetical protein
MVLSLRDTSGSPIIFERKLPDEYFLHNNWISGNRRKVALQIKQHLWYYDRNSKTCIYEPEPAVDPAQVKTPIYDQGYLTSLLRWMFFVCHQSMIFINKTECDLCCFVCEIPYISSNININNVIIT